MDPALAPLYDRARERLTEAEFVARIEGLSAEFDGLLDEEALALLILDELGLNDGAFVPLADLRGRAEASVRVGVERVEAPREFAREGRPPGRVAGCVVRDATGEARLTLWDKDVEKVEDGTLRPGVRVTVVNARVKEGRFGTELHVGPWTALEVEGAPGAARRKLLQDVAGDGEPAPPAAATLRGILLGVTPTRVYRRADGAAGFACDLDLQTDAGRERIVVWDEAVRAARALQPMRPLVVEEVAGRAGEWRTTPSTRFSQA